MGLLSIIPKIFGFDDKVAPQPAAPSAGGAVEEGVYADISTLETRRKIERAARLGEVVTYIDPRTGEERTADFTNLGDAEITKSEAQQMATLAPFLSQVQLDNLRDFGPQFIAAQREQMRQADPEGFGLREEYAGQIRRGEDSIENLFGTGTAVPDYLEAQAPTLADTGMSPAAREELEGQIFGELGVRGLTDLQQGILDQELLRELLAGGGAALGGAGAVSRAQDKIAANLGVDQQRRGAALGLLASGQTTGDTENRLAQQSFANAMQRVQQVNQARQQGFAAQQQNLGQQIGARQQDRMNVQSLLGLQPVAAQGGLMAGFQQGAAPFTIPQIQRGTGLDPNAAALGAGFAQNVFGTQAGMWGTQVGLPSAWERFAGMSANMGKTAAGFGSGLKDYRTP